MAWLNIFNWYFIWQNRSKAANTTEVDIHTSQRKHKDLGLHQSLACDSHRPLLNNLAPPNIMPDYTKPLSALWCSSLMDANHMMSFCFQGEIQDASLQTKLRKHHAEGASAIFGCPLLSTAFLRSATWQFLFFTAGNKLSQLQFNPSWKMGIF